MSDQENSNAQVAPIAEPPVAAGPTAVELQAKIAELERQSEGRLRDLQQERQKRQEYESRMSAPVAQPAPEQDSALREVVDPFVAPVRKQAEEAMRYVNEMKEKDAWNSFALRASRPVAELREDKALQDRLLATAMKYGITGTLEQQLLRTYELVELEDLRTKDTERKRDATIAKSQPLGGGTTPAPASSRSYSAQEFKVMSSAEYDKLSRIGGFKKDANGQFVYTPQA